MKSLAEATHALTHETGPADRTTDAPRETPRESATPERIADQDLVHRLKASIDQRGRYSFRLDDMAYGYAAGQGIPFAEARRAIEARFEQQFGRAPHAYLDRHYAERRESPENATPERTAQRPKEVGLER